MRPTFAVSWGDVKPYILTPTGRFGRQKRANSIEASVAEG